MENQYDNIDTIFFSWHKISQHRSRSNSLAKEIFGNYKVEIYSFKLEPESFMVNSWYNPLIHDLAEDIFSNSSFMVNYLVIQHTFAFVHEQTELGLGMGNFSICSLAIILGQ